MIITCNNCYKKFNINSTLIPDNGRKLECGACKHQWFFKKEIANNSNQPITADLPIVKIDEDNKKKKTVKIESSFNLKNLDNEIDEGNINENIDKKVKVDTTIDSFKNENNYNILGIIIVFIISFIALIIILDTFQAPISKIVPNIEFILYNLYETINDIGLFLKDLI